jgi:hypothetical protein
MCGDFAEFWMENIAPLRPGHVPELKPRRHNSVSEPARCRASTADATNRGRNVRSAGYLTGPEPTPRLQEPELRRELPAISSVAAIPTVTPVPSVAPSTPAPAVAAAMPSPPTAVTAASTAP